MTESFEMDPDALERYRAALRMLARLQIGTHLHAKLDASDVVQQTLAEAHEKREQFRGRTDAECMAWLRQMLVSNVAMAARRYGTNGRDVRRERSLDHGGDSSAAGLESWLAADQSSPSQRVMRDEELVRLASALTLLPDDQRQAIELHHLKGLTVAEVGQAMQRSRPAVAGLIFRGLNQLRQILKTVN